MIRLECVMESFNRFLHEKAIELLMGSGLAIFAAGMALSYTALKPWL